ncbi:hypothetical protein C8C94_0764 [Acidovorax sp. 94]|uniref:hypothetical protein n=1 Tax=Acidovorax sp. 94 TaxID=2135633 RepID=UPI000EAF2699|nr:hypothetical protein [Acidovorax sp. 94]RKR66308.1 hypothetical protein C8C94_0764 [Acidovorax sp. 94]
MSADLSCPVCGAEFDLAVLFKSEESRKTFERLTASCSPLGDRLAQYAALAKPPKHKLGTDKSLRIIKTMLPDIERGAITWKGRDWAAPLSAWAQAIDQMLAQRDAGRLELPMKGHGYLYAILAGMADRFEGQAEQQREQELRTGPRAATVNGPASVADLVQAPALNPEPRPARAAPAPAGPSPLVRAMREQIAKKKGTTP